MLIQLSRHWWWLVLRGIATILFGLIAFAWRGDTLDSFMLLFAGFALLDGIVAGLAALVNNSGKERGWILLHGLVEIVIAVMAVTRTESTASVILYLVAASALLTGVFEMVQARELRRYVSNEWLLALSGKASITFAVLVTLIPKTGMLSISATVGAVAILFGLLTAVLGLNIQNLGKYWQTVQHISAELAMSHNGSRLRDGQFSRFDQGDKQ